MTYDVAVIGGGPAGCAAAITAARLGGRVLLLEAGSFPRHKVCGEFVSSESLALLRSLLVDSAVLDSAPRIARSRFFSDGLVIESGIAPSAASIPRFALDEALWHAAENAGCDAVTSTRIRCVDKGAICSVNRDFRARSIVNATGRWSEVSRPASPGETWLGVKAHFREAPPSPSVDLYFFDGGYCGVQPIGAGSINAAAVVRADRASSLNQVLQLHPALAARSIHWQPLTPEIATAPLIHAAPQPVSNNVANVGDSACFIDPFCGDGISLALHTGTLAAQCLAPVWQQQHLLEDCLARYAAEYTRRTRRAFAAAGRLRRISRLSPALRRPAMHLLRVPAFSALVIRATRVAPELLRKTASK